MAYVALSRVKEMKNLHLIAFDAKSVMVSSKCLQEINCLRQTYRPDLPLFTTYRPDLPLFTLPSAQSKNKRIKLTAPLLSVPPPPKQSDAVSAGKRKKADKSQNLPLRHVKARPRKLSHISIYSVTTNARSYVERVPRLKLYMYTVKKGVLQ